MLDIGVEMANKYIAAGIVIIVIAVVGLALALGNNPGYSGTGSQKTTTISGSGNSSGSVVLALTDPPQAPPGTSALILAYTGIMLHEAGTPNSTGSAGFIDVNASGSVDLMTLTNVSQILAIAKVPANASFDSIVFTGASAKITINNSTFNVTVPSSRLQVKISGNLSNNGTALIDLAPSVVQIYGGTNATQNIFVMVPFAKAFVLSGSSSSAHASVGERTDLSASEHAQLKENTANVSIRSASLAEQGNTMVVSVTVENSGNSSATLRHLFVRGLLVTSFNGIVGSGAEANSGLDVNIGTLPGYGSNATVGITLNSSMNGDRGSNGSEGSSHTGSSGNESMGVTTGSYANASLNNTIEGDLHERGNLSATAHAYVDGSLEFEQEMHSSLNFIISQNATLSLPQDVMDVEGQSGYVIAPGSTVTLSYDGMATFGESGMGAQLIPNQTYSIAIQGEAGARAMLNSTAT